MATADVFSVTISVFGKKKSPPTYCKLCTKQIVLQLFVYFNPGFSQASGICSGFPVFSCNCI